MERTIPHLDEGTIQALVHDELSASEETEALRHADNCAGCQDQVARAREEDAWVRARLSALDVHPPVVHPAEVLREAHRRISLGRWRRAATITLVAGGAGIAWAMPPVRGFVTRLLSRSTSTPVAPPQAAVPGSARSNESPSGIAITPGPRFVVTFEASQASGEIRVRLVDEPELSVIVHGGPVPLESRQDELVVRNREAVSDYEVGIPIRAPLVEVRIAGVRRFLKQGARVDAGESARGASRYVIPLRP